MHFEQNLINWLHLRFSLNIYVWVGGAFGLIYYVTSRQNSLCKLIWSFFSFLATSEHRREDFLSRPPLPTHLSKIIMLCCMLLLNCSSYLLIYLFPYCGGSGQVCDESSAGWGTWCSLVSHFHLASICQCQFLYYV